MTRKKSHWKSAQTTMSTLQYKSGERLYFKPKSYVSNNCTPSIDP